VENNKYILEMKEITKEFPGVKALKGVDLKVKYGEVHALMGENGAGKSTIMKCIIGIHAPTSGEIYFCGNKMEYYDTETALNMGISMIHQELSPVLHRPIMENIWLGREPKNKFGLIDHKKMYKMTEEILKEINLDINPKALMKELTVANIQMIEIAKAISYDAKLIIMDEPTSALTEKEVNRLFQIIEKLKKNGKSIIYTSHKLDEIFEIADTITVFRDGQYIGSKSSKDMTMDEMIKMMVGRDVSELFPKYPSEIGGIKLKVRNLNDGNHFNNINFNLRKGEILGFAGLVGAGRTEVMESIFGLRELKSGKVVIDEKEVNINSSYEAVENKMAFLTEDRKETGIFPMLTIQDNMIISNVSDYIKSNKFIDYSKVRKDVKKYIDILKIKTPGPYQKIGNLSGGNQQKVLIARWLLTSPEILILDEPTRGIDVGAKSEIHKLISKLACDGKSIILISSELPEVMGMSDRIVVMHEGKITGILENNKELTQEKLMEYATNKENDYRNVMNKEVLNELYGD
jgi:methyl-galactoside transport system ATP-binding protein/inositol transport system ATP-binding protein